MNDSPAKLRTWGESYVFDSWDELLTRLSDAPNQAYKRESSRKTSDRKWSGTESYEAAEKLAREGWLSPVSQIERLCGHVESKVDASILTTDFQRTWGVAGSEVDMSLYLDGDPECMIESAPIRISRHGRAVRVVIPCVYSSGCPESEILGRGAAVVALSDTLAKAQHPLEIWAAYAYSDETSMNGPGIFQALVRVQQANEPIDLGRLGFALAHPSSLRRIGFRCAEALVTTSRVATGLGYGYGYGTGQVDVSQLDEAENTITVPNLGRSRYLGGTCRWEDEDFQVQWVQDQLARIFD
jgi:hypothetical protein